MTAVAASPIIVEMKDGRGCNPVGKVYKRFQNGPDDSIAGFFQVMTSGSVARPSGLPSD